MLWVLFNRKGQYIGQATQGNLPASGTTLFQIFAVFSDLDIEQYNGASITFYKPDLTMSGSYALPMEVGVKKTFTGESEYFQDGIKYKGCLFDFSDFKDAEGNSYLDTPGNWRAVITLLYPKSKMIRNVVGSVTFTVLSGLDSDVSVDIDINNILNRIYALLAQKLSIVSPAYVKAIYTNDIDEFEFDSELYNENDVIWNRYDNKIYQLDNNLNPVFVDAITTSVFSYKGSVETYGDLPTEDLENGDVYYVEEEDVSYAWNGETWDELSGIVDLSNYYTKVQINNLLNGKADKSDTYTKAEVDSAIAISTSRVYRFKGNVATYGDLPSTDNQIGDVYNVEDTGDNYAWDGTGWDKLAGNVDLSNYYTKSQTDNLLADKVSKTNVGSKLYGTDTNGTQTTLEYTTLATTNTIVQRGASGQITLPSLPVNDTDAVNKKYVADNYGNLNSNNTWSGENTFSGDIHTDSRIYMDGFSIYDTNTGKSLEEKINENLAPEYDSTVVYSIGNKVVYNDDLYTCLVNMSAAEAWDSTHWEKVKVSTGFVDLDSAQTISGVKTFGSNVQFNSAILNNSGTNSIRLFNSYTRFYQNIVPNNTTSDIGSSDAKWQDLYLSRYLTDGTNSLSISQIANNSFYGTSAYDNTATYAVGAKCLYNNKLYVCTTAVTIAEDFDSTKWTEVTLNDYGSLTGNNTWSGENNIVRGKRLLFARAEGDIGYYVTNDSNKFYVNAFGMYSDFVFGDRIVNIVLTYNSIIKRNINHTYGLTIPDTTNFTANKEIATTDQAFNVINASDIVSNTLTQAQYDLITNGKPTLISGILWGNQDPLIISLQNLITTWRGFMFVGRTLTSVLIDVSSKEISIGGNDLRIEKLNQINGKGTDYYQNNVYPYASNSTTTLQYETINDISISADTTFTLATAPVDTYPEYKANITNTDTSNAITITLPSGTLIKGNVTISSNTFVIPAGSEVEVNIQNARALVVEW